MHIDRRLETIANLVPQGCVLADIGTDHAYLPVWLLEKQRISRAIAGDIAAGPCQAARTTVAQFGQHVNLTLPSDIFSTTGNDELHPPNHLHRQHTFCSSWHS